MKHTIKILWVISFLFVLLSSQDLAKEFTPVPEFIFRGTIILPNASTIDVEDVSELAIVKVDEVLKGTKEFMSFRGQNITIWLKEPGSAKKNSQRVFFTRSWYFGESIGVVEIKSMAAEPSIKMQEIKAKVERVEQEQEEKELVSRLSRTQLIVLGRVVTVTKAKIQEGVSEHVPDWHEAEIEVEKVLKGTHSDQTIRIMFPKSDDVMWYTSPKFKQGMEGIWLLNPFVFAGRKLDCLTPLDKADFRAKSEEERIISLLGKR